MTHLCGSKAISCSSTDASSEPLLTLFIEDFTQPEFWECHVSDTELLFPSIYIYISRDVGASRRQVLKKEFFEAARGYRVYIQQNIGSDFFG